MEHADSQAKLDVAWKELLGQYPDGVSNTSTTKYDALKAVIAEVAHVVPDEIYITGAKTRTSNLDTRLVQGNQAGRHTKLGVAVIQKGPIGADVEALSNSAVVTCKKFVDGSDRTQYDAIAVFVEDGGALRLTRIIERTGLGISKPLTAHFPGSVIVPVGNGHVYEQEENSNSIHSEVHESAALNHLVQDFVAASVSVQLVVSVQDSRRLFASMLSKRFVIVTGLSGSGKTKFCQAVAQFLDCSSCLSGDYFGTDESLVNAVWGQPWTRDELLVVLDLYQRMGTSPGTERDEVAKLTGRTEDSIDLRLANYLGLDPRREQQGLNAGGRAATELFQEYEGKVEALRRDVAEARRRLEKRKAQRPYSDSNSGESVENRRSGLTACCALVPVGADWTGNENILGYPDGLDFDRYVSRAALKLILDAIDNPEVPHFLILDEMNLSHVERYFADFLSAMESGQEIPLYEGSARRAGERDIPCRLKLPGNLFVIGTVNVDETTYMFSPKVLDRANVIEFRMAQAEMHAFLQSPAKPNLGDLQGKGAHFAKVFVLAAISEVEVPTEVRTLFAEEMKHFFALLGDHHAEFGYRTAHEAARFIHFYKDLGDYADDDAAWFPEAMDCVIAQKLLPKLHGSRTKLGPLLKDLWSATVDAPGGRSLDAGKEPRSEQLADAFYPTSAEKVYRMWKLLGENGFASFAEA